MEAAYACLPATAMTGAAVTPGLWRALFRNRHKQFVIDGEAVILGVDGIADFMTKQGQQFNRPV